MAKNPERNICPKCSSDRTVKNGSREDRQLYRCNGCGRQYRDGGAVHGHHFSPEQIGAAIATFYSGRSYRETATWLRETHGFPDTKISHQTVCQWVRRYTDAAVDGMGECRASTVGRWLVSVTQISAAGLPGCWVTVDEETGCIVAHRIGRPWDENEAVEVIRKALSSSDLPREEVASCSFRSVRPVSYGLREYFNESVREVIRSEFQGAPWVGSPGDMDQVPVGPTSERTLPLCLTALRKLRQIRSAEAAYRYIDGLVVTYNCFIGQEEKGGRPPGLGGDIDAAIAGWTGVVRMNVLRG